MKEECSGIRKRILRILTSVFACLLVIGGCLSVDAQGSYWPKDSGVTLRAEVVARDSQGYSAKLQNPLKIEWIVNGQSYQRAQLTKSNGVYGADLTLDKDPSSWSFKIENEENGVAEIEGVKYEVQESPFVTNNNFCFKNLLPLKKTIRVDVNSKIPSEKLDELLSKLPIQLMKNDQPVKNVEFKQDKQYFGKNVSADIEATSNELSQYKVLLDQSKINNGKWMVDGIGYELTLGKGYDSYILNIDYSDIKEMDVQLFHLNPLPVESLQACLYEEGQSEPIKKITLSNENRWQGSFGFVDKHKKYKVKLEEQTADNHLTLKDSTGKITRSYQVINGLNFITLKENVAQSKPLLTIKKLWTTKDYESTPNHVDPYARGEERMKVAPFNKVFYKKTRLEKIPDEITVVIHKNNADELTKDIEVKLNKENNFFAVIEGISLNDEYSIYEKGVTKDSSGKNVVKINNETYESIQSFVGSNNVIFVNRKDDTLERPVLPSVPEKPKDTPATQPQKKQEISIEPEKPSVRIDKTPTQTSDLIYTATFDSDGGNHIDTQYVSFYDKIIQPNDPIKDGYIFLGWMIEDDENHLVSYDFDTKMMRDIKLIAKWKKVEDKQPENKEEKALPSTNDSSNLVVICLFILGLYGVLKAICYQIRYHR